MSKNTIQIFECGPSTKKCRCNCNPITGRDCEHQWDGPVIEEKDEQGRVRSASVTCSKCGMDAMTHDMWVAP